MTLPRIQIAPIALGASLLFATCSASLAWDTEPLASKGTIWSEFVPDREGRIANGPSNAIFFAGISHESYGGDYSSAVLSLVQYGEFVEQVMSPELPATLDQYSYERGMPIGLDFAVDHNQNRAIAYTVHSGGGVEIRCATLYGSNSWTIDSVVPPISLTPFEDTLWLAVELVDQRAAVAYVASTNGLLNWCMHESDAHWTTELIATNASGPVAIAVSPQGIPTVSFVSDNQYRWAYRLNGYWNLETVSSGRVACAALAFDRNGAIATAFRPDSGSNILYALRGTFGGWNPETILSSTNANHIDLEFDPDDVPAVAYSDNYNAFFAQPVGSTTWSQTVAGASTSSPAGYYYSWQYKGREPDLLYLNDGTPIILHHGYSGNYKVSSRSYVYYTSWAPIRSTPMEWLYHDDADGIDDRTTVPISGLDTYAVDHTAILDSANVAIRMLSSKNLQNFDGQMWVHWWNGSEEHWVRGYLEADALLEAGTFHGLPVSGVATVAQWRCDIDSSLTRPGTNYYAVQVKVGSTPPLGEEVFDEDWLLRDITDSGYSSINNVGQSVSDTAEFADHDWSIAVLADQDGDAIPDEWEETHGLSPTNPADASLDFDGDGVPNDREYVANSDPTNRNSIFAIENLTAESLPRLSFWGCSNRLYTLESSVGSAETENGIGTSWQNVPFYTRIRGFNVLQEVPCAPSQTSQFFRIRVTLP